MTKYVTEHPVFRNLKNDDLLWRNFSGSRGDYNPEGVRNFNLKIKDEEVALRMKEDGWLVKWKPFKNDPEDGNWVLKVNVRFGKFPPKIVINNKGRKKQIFEDEVNLLDALNFESVKVKLSPYNGKRSNGEPYVSAYLEGFVGVLAVDEFDIEYEDPEDSALGSIGGCGCCDICDGSCRHNDDD